MAETIPTLNLEQIFLKYKQLIFTTAVDKQDNDALDFLIDSATKEELGELYLWLLELADDDDKVYDTDYPMAKIIKRHVLNPSDADLLLMIFHHWQPELLDDVLESYKDSIPKEDVQKGLIGLLDACLDAEGVQEMRECLFYYVRLGELGADYDELEDEEKYKYADIHTKIVEILTKN